VDVEGVKASPIPATPKRIRVARPHVGQSPKSALRK